MSITSRINVRRARYALVSLAVAGAGLGAFLGTSSAASAAPSGYVTVVSCSSVSGKTTFSPGLLKTTARSTTAKLSATVAGCNSLYSGPMLGAGTLTASLSGSASVGSENLSGTFVVDWPGGTLNPSSGTVGVYDSNGIEYFEGTITSGAMTGAPIDFAYAIISHKGAGTAGSPLKSQGFVNSTLLTVQENDG
jgi:hypothetical protein